MNIELINALKLISLFKELNEDELKKIADQFESEQFPSNAVIIQEGDYGDKVYFILEGIVDVYIITKEGKEQVITSLSKGNYFGELVILIDGFRNNSIRAKTACKLLSLSKEKFETILDQNIVVSRTLNKVLSRRLGETLHLMSAKKENIIILMILSTQSTAREKHFEEYLIKLSTKPVIVVQGNIPQSEFLNKRNELDNHYILVKCYENPPDYLQKNANHTINFVSEIKNHVFLPENVSLWKIENSVRKITKKTIGIALCSGGAPGAAQLGVLKVLQEHNIPIDYIVGTSVGSIIGGGYAFSYPVGNLMTKFFELSNQSVLMSMATLFKNVSFKFSGFLKNSYYRKIFTSVFHDQIFDDAHIPFAAVASDLYSGKTVVLKSGKVVDAIIASNTAPVLFEPYIFENKLLIDGVATNPLPVDVLINESIDIKISVPIPQLDLAVSMKSRAKLISIYVRSRSMMAEQITQSSSELSDVIIRPNVEGINMNDWKNLNQIIKAGEDAANVALKRINYLLYGSTRK